MTTDRSKTHVEIVFECGHTVFYPKPAPTIGEVAMCRKCNDYMSVMDAPNSPFRIKCRDCQLGQRYGADGITAGRRAASHLLKRPSHTVDVYQGEKLAHTLTNETPSLFGSELRRVSKETQTLLRTFVESTQTRTE